MGWQKGAKIDSGGGRDRGGSGPGSPHTYSSSSYSFGGQTATTRSIQSCGEKVCDTMVPSGIDGMSAPDTPFPFLGTMAQDQLAQTFFPWEGGPS